MKPIIVYVDDEINQHFALEQLVPEDWKLFCFDSPLNALSKISDINPCLILSDQRMPQMPGFKFLENVKNICPDAIRIITTGYNDEQSIVDSIRKANIFDYLVKPWEPDKLLKSLERAIEFYESEVNRKTLALDLKKKNEELLSTLDERESLLKKYQEVSAELKSWVHPFVLMASENKLSFPLYKDLSLLVLDIVDSSKLHQISTKVGVDLRVLVLQKAWETILKNNGEIESHEGDKIYANFGLSSGNKDLALNAFNAAIDFKFELNKINIQYGINVSAGIALHYAQNCKVNLRESIGLINGSIVNRKKFDTSSIDIDLCHRAESLSHKLSGTNIIISHDLFEKIDRRTDLHFLGDFLLKGQIKLTKLYVIKSDVVSSKDLEEFKAYLNSHFSSQKAG